jgi:hypothetical protein
VIKADEAANLYKIMRKRQGHVIYHEVQPNTGTAQKIHNQRITIGYSQTAASVGTGQGLEYQYLCRVN